MTELALYAGRRIAQTADYRLNKNAWRLLVFPLLFVLLVASPGMRDVVFGALADAYLAVTVFVGFTLALVYGFESHFKTDIGKALQKSRHWQVPIAAILGALPGCGGAIIVVTQYTRGYVSFGGVVAVLIATMGDAAFLLLAREPGVALGIFAVSFVLGSLFGWVIDAIHGQDFLRPKNSDEVDCPDNSKAKWVTQYKSLPFTRQLDQLWITLLVPGAILGVLGAFLIEDSQIFGETIGQLEISHWLGVTGALLCVFMWGITPSKNSFAGQRQEEALRMSLWRRIIKDTNFITAWVVFGFLVYEIVVFFAGTGIEHFFKVWAPLVPLMGVVIGFLPGCGPQIVVTTMYLAGLVPLSAQLGNSISNDGDALFPAIALAPRAAVIATAYSALPALIVAYGYYAFFE